MVAGAMLATLTFLYVDGFYVALALVFVAAMAWGGRDERLVASLCVAALAATRLLEAPAKFRELELGVLVVDGLFLAALAVLAIRSGRWWLIWAAAFQALGVLGHLGKLVNPGMSRMAYGLMESASSYPVLIALAVAVFQRRRRMRAGG